MTRRISFSEREGIVEKPIIQIKSMNDELRTSIWNIFYRFNKSIADRFDVWQRSSEAIKELSEESLEEEYIWQIIKTEC
jgi:hypothetical protein